MRRSLHGILGAARVGVAIAAVCIAGTGLAQGPGDAGVPRPGFGEHRPPVERAFGGPGIQGRWWNNPKIAEALKLSDEQRKAFDGILLQHRETLIDLHASLEKAELALEPLIKDDEPNEGKILAQIDKVAQARAELEKANARYLLAIRGKLTPEQWKQVQAFRDNREQRRDGMGRDGMHRGGPGREGWKPGSPEVGRPFHRQGPPLPPPPPTAPEGAAPATPAAPTTPGSGEL